MGLERQGNNDFSSRHKSSSCYSNWGIGKQGERNRYEGCFTPVRQSMRGTYYQRHGVDKPDYDARSAKAESGTGQTGLAFVHRVDSIRRQQVHRCVVATLVPCGPASVAEAQAFHIGWDESPNRRISIATPRRASLLSTATDDGRTSQSMGHAQTSASIPPVDLLAAVVRKLRVPRAQATLLMPACPQQPWHSQALHLASSVISLPNLPTDCWVAAVLIFRYELPWRSHFQSVFKS